MPHAVCQTSGKRTTAKVMPCASGCGYSVTAACHAASPENAARLFQRWMNVHSPSGRMESAEPRRLLMNEACARSSVALLAADTDSTYHGPTEVARWMR